MLQFHPTAVVAANGSDAFLVTEAVRGEGALLLDSGGERFVDELAPRDEVARAIQGELERTGARSVDLDMRRVDPALFPNVVSALRRAGIDPERELVPVAPGGALHDGRDRHRPRRRARRCTGLFAVGECSCTGSARRQPARVELADRVLRVRRPRGTRRARRPSRPPTARRGPRARHDSRPASARRRSPRPAATRSGACAGIERDAEGLRALLDDPYPLVRLIAASALARTESRGAHQRRDFSELDPRFDHRHVTLGPTGEPALEEWR